MEKNQIVLVQKGGFVSAIVEIVKTGLQIAALAISSLFGLKDHFKLHPDGERWWYPPFDDWYVGTFWKFIFFCIKSSFYLLIFAFGGPVVTLIGIIYLYFNIYKQNIEPKEDKKNNNSNNSSNNTPSN